MCDFISNDSVATIMGNSRRTKHSTWSLVPAKTLMAPAAPVTLLKRPRSSSSSSVSCSVSKGHPIYTGCFATVSFESSLGALKKLNKEYHQWSVKLNRKKTSALTSALKEPNLLSLNQDYAKTHLNNTQLETGVPLLRASAASKSSPAPEDDAEAVIMNLLQLNKTYLEASPSDTPSRSSSAGVPLQRTQTSNIITSNLTQLLALNQVYQQQVVQLRALHPHGDALLQRKQTTSPPEIDITQLLALNQSYQLEVEYYPQGAPLRRQSEPTLLTQLLTLNQAYNLSVQQHPQGALLRRDNSVSIENLKTLNQLNQTYQRKLGDLEHGVVLSRSSLSAH